MTWIVVGGLVLVALVALGVLVAKLKLSRSKPEPSLYRLNEWLFSPAERSFLGVLEQAAGNDYRVFGKVRVADVVAVKSSSARGVWQRAFNRINAKHFDFVVCRNGDLSIACAVELDDQSHKRQARQDRDAFLLDVCSAISLPFLQVRAQHAYTIAELRTQLCNALNKAEPFAETVVPEAATVGAVTSAAAVSSATQSSVATKPFCPKCGAPMRLRTAHRGANAGSEFWGCSTYPKCRAMIPVA